MNPLFNDEKHYLTLNNYLKSIYNKKVFKVTDPYIKNKKGEYIGY